MHGRVKVRTTEQERAIKEKEREKKRRAYQAATKAIFEKGANKEYDDELLSVTAHVLAVNPDVYTVWNIRRDAILSLIKDKDETYIQELLDKDLSLTVQSLRSNGKSYSAWHHLVWVLTLQPKPNWRKELDLITQALKLDERNFHCWDYRRWIISQDDVISDLDNLAFLNEKIQTNFSNYSAWHYRSKLLPEMFPCAYGNYPVEEQTFMDELELVQNAIFTDPGDQSAWLYLQWLIGYKKAAPNANFFVKALRIQRFPKPSVIIILSQAVSQPSDWIRIVQNDYEVDLQWKSTHTPSAAWLADLKPEKDDYSVALYFGESNIAVPTSHLVHTSDKESIYYFPDVKKFLGIETNGDIRLKLKEQLENCLQLVELEPNSKWPLATCVAFYEALGLEEHNTAIFDTLKNLEIVDPFRKNYYRDLRSKFALELEFGILPSKQERVTLSNMELTAIYNPERLSFVHEIDLRLNSLRNVEWAYALYNCVELNVDNNDITSLDGLEACTALQKLSAKCNKLSSGDSFQALQTLRQLSEVDVEGNPICQKKNWKEDVAKFIPNVKLID